MPGVFEPCTRLDHLGWLRYLASQTPLSRSIGSLASCSGDGSVWILVTSGSLNSNSTRARPAVSPSLCPVVMHSPVTGLFRVLLDRFLLPTIPSPLQATYDWAYPIGSPFSIAIWVTDSCASLGKNCCSCTSSQNIGVLLLTHHSTIEIDLATPSTSQRSCSVARRSVTESLLLVTMLYFVMPNFVWKC